MPLRFDLGPFEELHIGRCMITNSPERSLFVVEGDMPILRGKEFLPEAAARTPLEKLYRCIQQMYLEEAYDKYQGRYLQLAAECLRNDPTLSAELEAGDQVVIKDGRFKGFYGVFDRKIQDSERVRILLNTVNFQAHVVVDRELVHKVATASA